MAIDLPWPIKACSTCHDAANVDLFTIEPTGDGTTSRYYLKCSTCSKQGDTSDLVPEAVSKWNEIN